MYWPFVLLAQSDETTAGALRRGLVPAGDNVFLVMPDVAPLILQARVAAGTVEQNRSRLLRAVVRTRTLLKYNQFTGKAHALN